MYIPNNIVSFNYTTSSVINCLNDIYHGDRLIVENSNFRFE